MAEAGLLHTPSQSLVSTDSYRTISELSQYLLNNGITSIPSECIMPENCRPLISYDDFSSLAHLMPVVDLAGVGLQPQNWKRAVAEITQAFREWGFCQVINHGVASELLCQVDRTGHDFFGLPTELKKRNTISFLRGYEGKFSNFEFGIPWQEALDLEVHPVSNVEDIAKKIWPQGMPVFCETMHTFADEVRKLMLTIFKMVAEGLGLETTFFSQHFEDTNNIIVNIRYNYVPACPQPSLALATFPHTDMTCITILVQDEVGGLQVQKDGKWLHVKPEKQALTVVLGDLMQGWCNGVFRAAIHRVLTNDKMPRLSCIYSCYPPGELVIQPPGELVDENHPLRHRPFTSAEYVSGKISRMAADPEDKNSMEVYAGVDSIDDQVQPGEGRSS